MNKENHIESSLEYMQHIPLIGDGVSNLKNFFADLTQRALHADSG